MYAVTGTLLSVELQSQSCELEAVPPKLYRQYLGGYGLGAALLLERMNPASDPLGPENILGFAAGYLTGTGAYIASRFMAFGKSPSTGGWGDANCGGYFGPKLKKAGLDVILFFGQARSPVYLLVHPGANGVVEAKIFSAEDLWGKDCYQTEDLLKERHGRDCEVACIGPAGENLAAVAGISTDKGRFAARSGLGAVMGSKKLKAVVLKGNLPIGLADAEKMKNLRKKYLPVFKEGLGDVLSKYGTSGLYDTALVEGDAPFKNWSSSVEEMTDRSTDANRVLRYQFKRYACSGCPIGCGGYLKVESGKFQTVGPVHKVQYETMGLLGSNLLNDDLESLIKVNELCNRYGLDTIGTGALVAYVIECYDRGLIGKDQTDGLQLGWGRAETIVALVEKIGNGEGIGAVLAKGFDEAVRVFGEDTAPYVMAVRGEALPAHDPRWNVGLALTYYLDPTPARHTQGSTTFPIAGYDMPEIDTAEAVGRAKFHSENVNWTHVLNSAGLCLFGYFILDYKTLPEFLKAADGTDWTLQELTEVGRRLTLVRQIFNVRAGWTLDHYSFPERALGNPPLDSGETKGVRVDLKIMVEEYLEQEGLDPKTGLPSQQVLEALDLAGYLS
jgi:aldehyde:ferredoxin oxidoreductase